MTPVRKRYFKKLILRGGRIIFPSVKIVSNPDIYIESGIIKKIGSTCLEEAEVITLGKDKYISPGFIDMHCHLREPGNTKSETIKTGTLAAIAGGFTKVCCMPNTNPPLDNPKIVKHLLNKAEQADNAEVAIIGCATKARAGKEVADIDKMVRVGIIAVSDDGSPISDALLMQKILIDCQKFNIPVINHCEVLSLSKFGMMNEGKISRKLGLKGIPDVSESIMVLRDIILAECTNSRVHIAHVSTKKSVDLIRWAKQKEIKVTAETCPHYFTLTDNDCARLNTNYKVSPPLKTKTDTEAIKEGLADGTIDVIATDHAPWHISGKQVKWERAKLGMIGFETAFSLGYEELVLKKYLSLEKYIACLTTGPAQALNLENSGKIEEGVPAQITIFDLNKCWVLSKDNIISKSKNSPFIGGKLKGKVEAVILKDKIFLP